MNIPSRKDCFKLILQMEMMDHIIDHSIMVSNVCFFLCQKLKAFSPHLDTRLATSAALLHDITKTRSFETKEIHSRTGGLMLSQLGYPEVGEIIRQHVVLDVYEPDSPVTEEEIVNYSDKRILHDQIVSLGKRLEYIKLRYGTRTEFKDHLHIMCANTLKLEHKLFCRLDITPDQLAESMIPEIRRQDLV